MATETTTLAPGAFCWVDLFTPDTEASRKFYGSLFGWQSNDIPMGPAGNYTMFINNGKHAAGMMKLHDEMVKHNVPTHWMSHVYVTDAAGLAKKAAELGGQVARGPVDIPDQGTMAVIVDPTGASFALWQPIKLGDAVYNVPGTLCWNELLTTDTAKAGDFYSKLLGWDVKEQDFGGMQYFVLENKGRGNGGMMTLPEEAKKMGAPPNWMAYFAVASCDDAVKKATELGAKVLVPAMEIPTVGRFSVLADPHGAAFAVIQLEKQPE